MLIHQSHAMIPGATVGDGLDADATPEFVMITRWKLVEISSL